MNAINGTDSDVRALASSWNVDVESLKSSLGNVNTALATLSAQTGMSSLQVINAIQAGNASLASQFAQCCCDNKFSSHIMYKRLSEWEDDRQPQITQHKAYHAYQYAHFRHIPGLDHSRGTGYGIWRRGNRKYHCYGGAGRNKYDHCMGSAQSQESRMIGGGGLRHSHCDDNEDRYQQCSGSGVADEV